MQKLVDLSLGAIVATLGLSSLATASIWIPKDKVGSKTIRSESKCSNFAGHWVGACTVATDVKSQVFNSTFRVMQESCDRIDLLNDLHPGANVTFMLGGSYSHQESNTSYSHSVLFHSEWQNPNKIKFSAMGLVTPTGSTTELVHEFERGTVSLKGDVLKISSVEERDHGEVMGTVECKLEKEMN